jgi:multidrug resistance efflux pump
LIAPFDGTVVWVGVRVGESAAVGTGAIVVADLSRLQLQLNVDEVSAAAIQVGQAVTITIDALPGKQVKGRVSSVALLGISGGNLVTVPATVDLDATNIPIFPGLSGIAEIQGVTP